MHRTWKGREAQTPELIPPFEDWESSAWRDRLVRTFSCEVVDRLDVIAFDRANELVALDQGRTVSTNWPIRFSGFMAECVTRQHWGPHQARQARREFELAIENLSNDARRMVMSARRSVSG